MHTLVSSQNKIQKEYITLKEKNKKQSSLHGEPNRHNIDKINMAGVLSSLD